MLIRCTLLTLVALASGMAQNPGRGPGRGGHFGPEFQGARLLDAEAGMPGRVVKGAPYSADLVTETTQSLSDGNHIRQTNTSHFARDSEGRTRREETLGGLGALGANAGRTQVVFINDPVAGANYALNPTNKTANKSAWAHPARLGQGSGPKAQFARPARPGGPRANAGIKNESLGTQTIEGVQAQGTRTTLTIPANTMGNEAPIQIVSERWYSADLQTVVLSKRSDPRSGETVTRLTNISRAEPAASVFQVPSDFKVTSNARPNHPQFGGGPAQQ